MVDDNYTIYPYQPDLGGSLKLGQQIVLCPDGGWADLNGPYCEWPKCERQQFIVTVDNDKLTYQDLACGQAFFLHTEDGFKKLNLRDIYIEAPINVKLTDKLPLDNFDVKIFKAKPKKDWEQRSYKRKHK